MNRDESLKRSRKISRWFYVSLGLVFVAIITGVVLWFITRQPAGTLPYPIPTSQAMQLGFDIYYPSQKLLPKGYTLTKGSFVTSNQVLLYSVMGPNNQRLAFSDQAKPTADQLLSFINNNIPLNTTLNAKIGMANISAIKSKTVVSLPTNTNAWLIITGPSTINQSILDDVLKSIEIAK